MKTYNQFINENLLDKMTDKSDVDIREALSKKDLIDWVAAVNSNGLDDTFLPTDEEIEKAVVDYDPIKKVKTIDVLHLDKKYYPTIDELSKDIKNNFKSINDLITFLVNYSFPIDVILNDDIIDYYLKNKHINVINQAIYIMHWYGIDVENYISEKYIIKYKNYLEKSKDNIINFSDYGLDIKKYFTKEEIQEVIDSIKTPVNLEKALLFLRKCNIEYDKYISYDELKFYLSNLDSPKEYIDFYELPESLLKDIEQA